MKKFFILIFSLFIFLTITTSARAVDCTTQRCAACDQCGYCWQLTPTPPFQNPPSNWEKCRNCIYETTGPATSNKTLIIDEKVNLPPTPLQGKMYTQLGCVGTNLGSFTSEGAGAGVVQALLNVIFGITGGLGFLTIIYASFLIMTSQSNPERLMYGKKVLFGAIAGVIFSFMVVFIVNLLGSGVLKIPGFSSTPTP